LTTVHTLHHYRFRAWALFHAHSPRGPSFQTGMLMALVLDYPVIKGKKISVLLIEQCKYSFQHCPVNLVENSRRWISLSLSLSTCAILYE
jgi:hypothetical protein